MKAAPRSQFTVEVVVGSDVLSKSFESVGVAQACYFRLTGALKGTVNVRLWDMTGRPPRLLRTMEEDSHG
jgi:hypothetical protein